MALPEINTWWPHLTIEARHDIVEGDAVVLSERVRAEIENITGERVDEDARLTDDDRTYARTQTEAVD